jgi:hypothetical protein
MKNDRKYQQGSAELSVIAVVVLGCVFVAAWFTHVIVCISEEAWGFLIAGAIMFPIAIIHGIGIWFGFF